MGSYFLSYSRVDQMVALRFASDLTEAGVHIWVDQIDIRPSDRWDSAVQNALHASAGVLLIMSPHSVASENVLDEISVALDAGKHVLPVLIAPCQPPLRLARVQFIDATQDYEAALARCKAALGAAQQSPAGAPAAPAARPISAAFIEMLGQKATPFLGPIARHLVLEESKHAESEADLIARISARVPTAEVVKFVASVLS